ncbi:MAG TPA: CvpA family protein [Xylella sp.]
MIDLILGIIILVSALLGLLRGFVNIMVGTSSWLLASWAAFQFGSKVSHWIAGHPTLSMTETLSGYALVFFGTLIAVGGSGMLIHAGIDAIRLNNIDRMFGFALGTLRGGFIACVLLLLMGYTPLPHEPVWRNSRLVPLLQPGVSWMRTKLPIEHPPSPLIRPMIDSMGLTGSSVSEHTRQLSSERGQLRDTHHDQRYRMQKSRF